MHFKIENLHSPCMIRTFQLPGHISMVSNECTTANGVINCVDEVFSLRSSVWIWDHRLLPRPTTTKEEWDRRKATNNQNWLTSRDFLAVFVCRKKHSKMLKNALTIWERINRYFGVCFLSGKECSTERRRRKSHSSRPDFWVTPWDNAYRAWRNR